MAKSSQHSHDLRRVAPPSPSAAATPQRPPPTGGGRNLDQNSWCFFSRNQQKTNTHPNRSQVIGDPQVAIGFNTKKKNKSWYHLTGAFYVGNGTGGCWDD